MAAVLAAELLKLRTARSTSVVLALVAVIAALGVLMAASGANAFDAAGAAERSRWAAVAPIEQEYLAFWQVCLAVLGALAVTAEYGSGMIRTTLAAVPRRGAVLAAKAGAVGALALAAGAVAVVGTHVAVRAVLGDRPFDAYTAPMAETVPLLAALSAAAAVAALVGLGAGVLLRSTAGAIVAAVALIFAPPMIARFLAEPWADRVAAGSLTGLPAQIAGTAPDPVLGPVAAGAVLAAYAVAALAAGAVALHRRDV
ncbi:ABC transporter permease [Streptomonospora sp. S1-112]|uniref:ABC transporter permease n=1 Tax=Streptomonospora mangrovi TaxID=2883123 RepID=A0A9X3NVZ7_9ACTN|nr:ABC transporter permease [Streptomonospora mangrovi]MDA0567905.1 ABC transporter permease [Streptomonospora mangrovi]